MSDTNLSMPALRMGSPRLRREPKAQPPAQPGPLVEDMQTVGGTDDEGAPVIRARRPGPVQESASFRPTDPQERLDG
jgi:hypothetical protein